MIFSKQSLYAVGVTAPDKAVNMLDNVLFCRDGTVVAACRLVVVVVETVPAEVKVRLHVEETFLKEDVMLSAANVKKLLGLMPTDVQFKGLLEYGDMELTGDGQVRVRLHDGMQEHNIKLQRRMGQYVAWGEIVRNAVRSMQDGGYKAVDSRVRINLKRLNLVISTIGRIIGDKSGEIPLYMAVARCEKVNGIDKEFIIKAVSPRTGQQVLAVSGLVGCADYGKEWVPDGKIERNTVRGTASRKKVS